MTDRELMQQVLDALEAEHSAIYGTNQTVKAIEALRARLAQPEPEPMAYKVGDATVYIKPPIYTAAPPQREWQGLTMEEVQEILTDPRYQMKPLIVHATEAKLKEKNT